MLRIDYVNDCKIIAQQPKMTAINSAIEIDLTGQVVADSIGTRMYSGFGGQVDFIRGAGDSFDGLGRPIIALPSVTPRNESKIVPFIKQGTQKLFFYSCNKKYRFFEIFLVLKVYY